jgi:hypothetical protein
MMYRLSIYLDDENASEQIDLDATTDQEARDERDAIMSNPAMGFNTFWCVLENDGQEVQG